jgi:hypothetical protein
VDSPDQGDPDSPTASRLRDEGRKLLMGDTEGLEVAWGVIAAYGQVNHMRGFYRANQGVR